MLEATQAQASVCSIRRLLYVGEDLTVFVDSLLLVELVCHCVLILSLLDEFDCHLIVELYLVETLVVLAFLFLLDELVPSTTVNRVGEGNN